MNNKEAIAELIKTAFELSSYASYAEIVGGLNVNNTQIRKLCDKMIELRWKFIEEKILEHYGVDEYDI